MNIHRFYAAMAAAVVLLMALVIALLVFSPVPAQAAPGIAAPAAQAPAASAFAALDTNKDQALSLQEFQVGYDGVQRAVALEIRLREQFRTVDVDHGGTLDADEYAKLPLVKRAGKAAPPLSTFDADKNQKLGFAEYVAVVRKLSAPQPAPTKKQGGRVPPLSEEFRFER